MQRDRLEPDERRRYQAAQMRLFAYMHERGIRPSWLAARLGVTRAAVWKYEHGGAEMPLARFRVACRELAVQPEAFGWSFTTTRRRTMRRAS